MAMALHIGIDVGSVATKGVVIDDNGVICHHIVPSGFNYGVAAETMRNTLLAKAGVSADDVEEVVITGCGAGNAHDKGREVSEIVCCARGIGAIFPSAKTVVSVGGQCSQTIRIDQSARVVDFAVSERCAAGSARFLQVMANVLRIELKDIGPLSLKATKPVAFSTGCAVFGETEAITRVAEGCSIEDILAGVHQSLASKVASLVAKIGLEEDCAVCGGGALDIGFVKTLEGSLGLQLLVPENPQIVTALGAAIASREGHSKGKS